MEPRPAATVIVARDLPRPSGQALEFLVIRRSAWSRFAPGFVVFPGGVVEERDRELAEGWFGESSDAPRACAVRELSEEAGLVLTRDGLVEAPGRLPGEAGLSPPDAAQIPEIARWVAPDFLPVRFDAHFFAVAVAGDAHPSPDGVEADRAWWSTAEDVLAATRAGEAPLMWPTLRMLQVLADCRSIGDVLELDVEQIAPPSPV
jgi:8-oxo-dGTP pyrophosphatase MutT (NUDIX family)